MWRVRSGCCGFYGGDLLDLDLFWVSTDMSQQLTQESGVMIGKLLTLAVLGLAAAPLAAQQHQHEAPKAAVSNESDSCMMSGQMMQMMQMMGEGQSATMMLAPDKLLGLREKLSLTAGQVSRIEAVRDRMAGAHRMAGMSQEAMAPMQAMSKHQQQLTAAFNKSPVDPEAIRTAAGSMATTHGAMMAEHLVSAASLRDILTPSQRERVAAMMSECMKGHSDMMPTKPNAAKAAGPASNH